MFPTQILGNTIFMESNAIFDSGSLEEHRNFFFFVAAVRVRNRTGGEEVEEGAVNCCLPV